MELEKDQRKKERLSKSQQKEQEKRQAWHPRGSLIPPNKVFRPKVKYDRGRTQILKQMTGNVQDILSTFEDESEE